MNNLTSQQVGKSGELLVQYILLKHGIESAPLTTDPGVDLVAFPKLRASPEERGKPVKIQVKTSTHHGPTGDKWLEWEIPEDCPADYIAAVDLVRDKFWIMSLSEFKEMARRAAKGQLRLWWSLPGYESKRAPRKEEQFNKYEMDAGIRHIFEIPQRWCH